MNRRGFLKLLGWAPLAAVVGAAPAHNGQIITTSRSKLPACHWPGAAYDSVHYERPAEFRARTGAPPPRPDELSPHGTMVRGDWRYRLCADGQDIFASEDPFVQRARERKAADAAREGSRPKNPRDNVDDYAKDAFSYYNPWPKMAGPKDRIRDHYG